MHPWSFSEENKRMVEDNIVHILNNYLKNPGFEYIIFSWVINQESIFDLILKRLVGEFALYKISLICSETELRNRIESDQSAGKNILKSLSDLNNYQEMDTIKIDSTHKNVDGVIEEILEIIKY